MPLPGGPADKFGNRYEGRWTVYCLTEILYQQASTIRPEPPQEDGFEFWLDRPGRRQFHQVKRQRGGSGRWRLADLRASGVLTHFREKLVETRGNSECVFVSADGAPELRELAERTRGPVSLDEYQSAFLSTSEAQRGNFDQFCSYLSYTPQEGWEALRRIEVRTMDEESLRENVEVRLRALVQGGEPGTVADVLAEFVLDNLHQVIFEEHIWHHLEGRGFRRRDWARDLGVLRAIQDANERYLDALRREVIPGRHHDITIPRSETERAVELIASGERPGVLISGVAGVGKSGVILQVADALSQRGWPMLAFRVDRVQDSALTPEQLGANLDLPGSPAAVLAAVARGRDCLLVIDQLDAVSLASGRAPHLFDPIEQVLKQVRAYPNVHLLLACRTFDLTNDHRLARLTGDDGIAQALPVEGLSPDSVRDVVARLGLDAARLTESQLRLLGLPLHLRLLAEVAPGADLATVRTAQDLYGLYWDRKRQAVQDRLGRTAQWTNVLDRLADHISERQSALSAPREIVDDWAEDAVAMASEHVLVEDQRRYAFFHESFFDYVFARRFVARERDLLALLGSGEQHLFRRAQLRQVLLYERQTDFSRYVANVRALLTEPDVRIHLKDVVLAILADLTDPREEEWRLLESLVRSPDLMFRRKVWLALDRSPAWMGLLDRLGVLASWLRDSDETHVTWTVALLTSMQEHQPDRVAELLEPFVGVDGWRDRFVSVVQRADLTRSRRFVELVAGLVDLGVLDDARGIFAINSDFWDLLYRASQQNPAWASELTGHYLNRRLALAVERGQTNPFLGGQDDAPAPTGQLAASTLSACAHGAPGAFVARVLPFIVEVARLNGAAGAGPLQTDSVWGLRYYGDGHQLHEFLLATTAAALGRLAEAEPSRFAEAAAELRASELETAQYLLVRTYTAAGARFADEAIDHVCAVPGCLELGYWNGGPYWASRQLLVATTPHCSDERLDRLQSVLLNFFPDWERGRGHRESGRAQFVLLEGIDPSRRSEPVKRRLAELQRKFGEVTPAPRPVTMQQVGPPVPARAAALMTDEQWLRAVRKYDRGRSDFHPERGFTGGASELSRLLAEQTHKEPARFAALLLQFPEAAHPSYFQAVLNGLEGAEVDPAKLARVWERCHELRGRPCGLALLQSISNLADKPLPGVALHIVSWYGTQDPSPVRETWLDPPIAGRPRPVGEAILTQGLNCVRGRAAEVVGGLIDFEPSRMEALVPVLRQQVRDPSLAVRSMVARALLMLLGHDEDLAVELFLELVRDNLVLVATPDAGEFIRWMAPRHYERFAGLLEDLVASGDPAVQEVGARQACLASLWIPEAAPLIDGLVVGAVPLRVGAAQVFAANVHFPQFRAACESRLVEFFDDDDEEVRSAAATCFRSFKQAELGSYGDLIARFTESRSFEAHYRELLRALEHSTARLPDATCRACERFLEFAGIRAADIRTQASADATTASTLILRVYSHTSDSGVQTRCLDVIDAMVAANAYGVQQALGEFER